MSAETATDVSWLEGFQTEWRVLWPHPHNVLLEGPVAATNAVLRLLQPHMRERIVWNPPRVPLELPSEATGTLILRDVAGLSAHDQTRLRVWLGRATSRTQIVSVTEDSLLALVARGLFDEGLYYRLNVMLLRVGSSRPRGLRDDHADRSQRLLIPPPTYIGDAPPSFSHRETSIPPRSNDDRSYSLEMTLARSCDVAITPTGR
jgi:hypothetical protein